MSVTQKSARATIEAYYKRAVAANSQWLKDREAGAKQDFENKYSACVFSTKEEKVKKFADLYVSRELRKGYGRCKVVQKLEDARMQFFEAFMQEDGFGGVEDQQEASPAKAPDQKTTRKLPGNAVQKQIRALGAGKKDRVQHARIEKQQPWRPIASSRPRSEHKADLSAHAPQSGTDNMCAQSEHKDESVNGLLKQFAETRVHLPPEDQATEAVRQAMEKFSM